jgi:MoxR-like ATPase
MNADFVRYRGDGTTPSGEPVDTPGERGRYIADAELVAAVNTMLAVEQPLLVTGEAGTGKTVLAFSVAAELELGDVLVFTVRSNQQGTDLLYNFDNLRRFYDAQIDAPLARDRKNYLEYGPLGKAIMAKKRKVVLIDEIDKAPRDFPNDLLNTLDRMEIRITELDLLETATYRPVVIITSNRESQLPDPFLRRCVFHHIEFPKPEQLDRILEQRLGHLELPETLRRRIVERFLEVRDVEGLQKKPATGELLTWVRVLAASGIDITDALDRNEIPFAGTLLKIREDMERARKRFKQ